MALTGSKRQQGHKHPTRLITAALLAAVALAMPLHAEQPAAPAAIADKTDQRQRYSEARTALQRGQYDRFHELKGQLAHYALLPYLEYAYIDRRFSHPPVAAIDRFLENYPDSYLAEKLRRRWVEKLARNSDWEGVERYHEPENTTTELTCYYLRARLRDGDLAVLSEVGELWNVGRSQPEACDPLFAEWMAADLLTGEIAWQRFVKAMDEREHHLARYIQGKMPDAERRLAELYRQVDRNPRQLNNLSRFASQSEPMQQIILHGLKRLARRDAKAAIDLWHRYDAQQLFEREARLNTQRYIAVRLLRQGHTADTEALLASTPALSSEDLAEWLVRDALRQQDWARVAKWIDQLPEQARQSNRWRYWQARILEQGGEPDDIERANALYQALAGTRSFYGFLSADKLGRDYELDDNPIAVSDATLNAVADKPGVTRAKELFILGDNLNARREWYHTTRQLDEKQTVAAGRLAESWGWHRNGIQAMIQIRYWDDIELRFPLAYRQHVTDTAEDLSVAPHLLYAIARQESAFTPDARSPAGALGLMQLLPSTARQTAQRSGMSFSTYDLLEPETNIALGGRYLNQLLEEFDGNRILAAAAYNAGPHRVKQWLNQDDRASMPFDVWIETIPYRETRGYVQNVLAYSVIYGFRLGEEQPFITDGEAERSF